MSTIIRTRTPFFVRTQQETSLSLAYFELGISIYKGTSGSIDVCTDIYKAYTLTKKPLPEEHSVTFEISQIINQHLVQIFTGSYPTAAQKQSLWVNVNLRARTATGAQIGAVVSSNYLAQEGFNLFEEGVNYVTQPSIMITSNHVQYLLTHQQLILPLNNEAVLSTKMFYNTGLIVNSNWSDNGQSTQKIKYSNWATSSSLYPIKIEAYSASNQGGTLLKTITLEPVDECKYQVNRIVFLNRWGAFQELYFFKKSTETMSVTNEKYNSSLFHARKVQLSQDQEGACVDNPQYNVYSTTEHKRKTFNTNATEEIQLNTGFVKEEMNSSYKELMVSEYVWMQEAGPLAFGDPAPPIIPVNLKDSSFTFKTSLNDRVINYTMVFNKSAEYINNVQ
tara:strand:+ start:2027 stop:3202 length:1176 start_codon:yes stop_codon:yes gene_type:complete